MPYYKCFNMTKQPFDFYSMLYAITIAIEMPVFFLVLRIFAYMICKLTINFQNNNAIDKNTIQ